MYAKNEIRYREYISFHNCLGKHYTKNLIKIESDVFTRCRNLRSQIIGQFMEDSL